MAEAEAAFRHTLADVVGVIEDRGPVLLCDRQIQKAARQEVGPVCFGKMHLDQDSLTPQCPHLCQFGGIGYPHNARHDRRVGNGCVGNAVFLEIASRPDAVEVVDNAEFACHRCVVLGKTEGGGIHGRQERLGAGAVDAPHMQEHGQKAV